MRKPTPVTMSIITPLSASTLKRDVDRDVDPPRPPVVCIHSHAVQASFTCCVVLVVDSWLRRARRRRATAATKLTPTAASAIRRTASLPRRLPQTPFTKAPSSGMPEDDRDEREVVRGEERREHGPWQSPVSVLEEVGLVGADGALAGG